MTTFIKIADVFKHIADVHLQIHSYGFGVLSDIASSGTIDYPLLYVEPDGSIVRKGEVGFKFNILLMDIVQKGKSNEIDVLNDTHQIMIDILTELRIGGLGKGTDYSFELKQNEITLTDFMERFDEEVAGWEAKITLWVEWDWNRCAIPKT